jgi:hypothetical protein
MAFGDAGGYTAGGYKPPASMVGLNPSATNQPVTAPAGTLLQQLQQQRQGGSSYGAIGQGLQNPEVLMMLASVFAPMSMARSQATKFGARQLGAPGSLQDIARMWGQSVVTPGTKANMLGQTGVNAMATAPPEARQVAKQYTTPQGVYGTVAGSPSSKSMGVKGLPKPMSPGASSPQYSTPSYGF